MPKTLRYVCCDVFTNRPLTGNALAVFTDAREIDGDTMQALARETNLSETTFVLRAEAGGDAKVRIFTPRRELPFAGHPVLGTAYALAAPLQRPVVRLETGVGVVPVRFDISAGRIGFGWMSQPVPKVAPFAAPEALLAALGLPRSALPIEFYDNGVHHVFVALDSVDAVMAVRPELSRLEKLPALCFGVFARQGPRFTTRVFAPGAGIAEDPATGGAAGPLGVHLVRHGWAHPSDEIVLEQGSAIRRPSVLHVRVDGSAHDVRVVEVGGEVTSVAKGQFILP